EAYRRTYRRLDDADSPTPSMMLTTYFGPLGDNLELACDLPVEGLHLDLARGHDLQPALDRFDDDRTLSLGLVDGRNVWRTDLDEALEIVETAADAIGPD
ncbi:MAG: 5-methyltetrahydropteroyltriglutamate--homocysteine S-methyltransferase, partial [Bradymonadaceae bacterium]